MYSVWKYVLDPVTEQTIFMPKDAEILKVDFQDEVACLWALVNANTGHPRELRTFLIMGTGRLIRDEEADRAVYIGTLHCKDDKGGNLVNHVFELME